MTEFDRPWHAHYDNGVPFSLEYPEETLPEVLTRTARKHPNSRATIFHGASMTYGEFESSVQHFASGVVEAGIGAGERMAVMLPNLPQFPVAFYGALRAGLVVVPTNPLYTARELAYQLADSGSTAMVTLPQFLPQVLEAIPSTKIRFVICATPADALPWYLRVPYRLKDRAPKASGAQGVRIQSWKSFLKEGDAPRLGKPEDVAVLQYTGGTTGTSKGAMLTHRSLIANAIQVFSWQGSPTRFSVMCVCPFFHVYGLTVCMNMSVWAAGEMIVVERFEAAKVRELIKKLRPNLFPGVPTMYIALNNLANPDPEDYASLEICISGAAPLPAEVHRQFTALSKATMVEGYGLTEASPVTHCNPCQSPKIGTVGVPFPDTDSAVVEPGTWDRVRLGEVGEVIAKGPQIMAGYWNKPDETAQVLKDGWLRTGDLASIRPDGYFTIVDRIKDVIIAGGYNIYPREVEEALFHHPAVLEASVVGAGSDYRGETVKAFIVLKAGETADEASIIQHCRTELAAYKVPKIVEFVDTLPKSLIGKVLRRRLREQDKFGDGAAEPGVGAKVESNPTDSTD